MNVEKEKLTAEKVTIEMVKYSTFGCINCLWHGVECDGQSKFSPDVYEGQPTCKAYAYYD